jgi:hypothetical protein
MQDPQSLIHHEDVAELLRPKAVARQLSVSRQRLARLRLEGGGPAFLKIGRSVLYAKTDLDAWLAKTRRVSTSDLGTGI